jgi:hypothetical protein
MKLAGVMIVASIAGCATPAERYPEEMRAACAAQAFLRANGYLDDLAQGPVALELMDGIGYGRGDGSIDWERLAEARHGLFSGRLVGVTRHSGGFSIFYDLGGPAAYVAASPDLSQLRVTHAPRRNQPEVRMSERTLRCSS